MARPKKQPNKKPPQEKIKELDNLEAQKQDLGKHEDHLRQYVVDGKNRTEEEVEELQALEKLLGIARSNPFGTINEDVFTKDLETKTKTDLNNLCMRVGISPRTTIEGTKEALLREFKAVKNNHGVALHGTPRPAADPNSPEGKKLKELLEN